jgi:hypothetical protein
MILNAARDPMQRFANTIRKCVGAACQRYQSQPQSKRNAMTAQNEQPTTDSFPTLVHSTKKDSKRSASALVSSHLAKRGVVRREGDPAYHTGYRRGRIYIPIVVPSGTFRRTMKWASASAITHGALLATGVMPKVETTQGLASAAAFHTFAGGIVAPLVYDTAMHQLGKCVGALCQKLYDGTVERVSPEVASELARSISRLRGESLTTSTAKVHKSTSQGSTKKATRRAKAKQIAISKRSLGGNDIDENQQRADLISSIAKAHNRLVKREPVRSRRLIGDPANLEGVTRAKGEMAIEVDYDTIKKSAKWATASVLTHGAMIAAGVLPKVETTQGLGSAIAFHSFAAGVMAPTIYNASMRSLWNKVQKCVVEYCQRLYDENVQQMSPEEKRTIAQNIKLIKGEASTSAAKIPKPTSQGSTKKASRMVKAKQRRLP